MKNDNSLKLLSGRCGFKPHLPGKCVRPTLLSAVLFLLIAGALLMAPQTAFAQAPTVSSIAITSDPGADKTYIFGEKVQVTLTFSESVTVDTTGGTPSIKVKFDSWNWPALYKSGSPGTAIVFELTLQQFDAVNGIRFLQNQLALNNQASTPGGNGTINATDDNTPADLNHAAIAADSNHKVDASGPSIVTDGTKITSTPELNSTYAKDEKIQVTVEWDQKAKLDTTLNNPYVILQVGSNARQAAYSSGTNTKKWIFAYTVATGDTDTDGIAINQFSIKILKNGSPVNATVKDEYGNTGYAYNLEAVLPSASHKVDSTTSVLPTITSIAFTSTPAKNKTYKKGDDIQATVTFNKAVTVDTTNGTPQLTLQIGTTNEDEIADYESGSGTKKLVFEYEVEEGDEDTDGIKISSDQLSLNGGTIVQKNKTTRNASLTHVSVPTDANHKVDGVVPKVSHNVALKSSGTNNYYKIGDKIEVEARFSENMTVDTTNGTPRLIVVVGTNNRYAGYDSGTGTSKPVFAYTIASGDSDTDGISVTANSLELNGGAITDGAGNPSKLTHAGIATQSAHKVDGVPPKVTTNGISITSTPTSNNAYAKDEKIQVTVTFDDNVTITGTPQLELTIGTEEEQANYKSGSGGTALVFEYTVVSGDNDSDGISIAANSLALNSGTMKDNRGNAATLTHTALAAQSSHKVQSVVAPKVSTVAITSTATNNWYKINDKIQVTVTFDKSVTIGSRPKVALKVGSAEKNAFYKSGSPGTAIVFEYSVASGDTDTNGIEIEADKLSLNNGTITDTSDSTVNAKLTHSAVAASTSHKVDGLAPTISTTNGVAITSTAKTYKIGDKIEVTVTFTDTVTVTNTPHVKLTIGSTEKNADYKSGSGSTALVFEYTVASGDEDTDGISIAANKVSVGNGSIVDSVGNGAALSHTALATQSSHKVSANSADITDIVIASDASNDTYSIGTTIQVWATFNRSVTVTGTPQLTLTIGDESKDASYDRTYNNVTLQFQYTIVEGDLDTDGISIAANSLKLNGGSIKDAGNKDASLLHDALATQSDEKVDGVKPTVSSFTMHSTPTNSTYKVGEDIEVKVTFNRKMHVNLTGNKPQLTLKIGTADKIAKYSAGFGTQHIRFKYRVVAGDVDTDGISIDANSFDLNGGTLRSEYGNDATLTHTAVAAFSGHKVDAIVASVSSVAFTSTATNDWYKIGDAIQITATFNKNVTVTGTPQVTLKLGTGNRTASYTSESGTKNLVFEYTVVSHDEDTDGVAIEANKLSAGTGGSIKDANDTNALLTHAAVAASTSHKVDGIAPSFDGSGSSTGIALTSSGPYGVGKKITITFQFTEKVKVTGTPQLTLTIGAATKDMDYKSGDDTNTLTFEYTVVAGDLAPNGLSVAANSLKLNSGTIKDAVGNAAVLTHRKSVNWIHQKVDTIAPTVSSIAITSTAQTYGVGGKIQATVTFSENVSVNTSGGIPQLTLNIGGTGKNAAYKSGDGSKTLIFEYTVAAGDNDTDGISIDANKLKLNGGTIKDGTSNNATLTHTALTAQASHIVDTTGPTVATNGISFTSTPKTLNTYAAGETIQATVTFDEVVYVTGTPQLTVQIGAFPVVADWTSGSGTKSLVFETTAQAGHEDTDGIEVKANKLALNGGTIKDGADNAVTLTHAALSAQSSHKVDGQSPTITANGVRLQTNPTKDNTYKKGEKIRVSVTFNDNVYVTGTPTLALNIGTKKQKASYTTGSGGTILNFEYTVVEGDKDTDGISIQNNALKGGTITDNVGNPASVVLTALATQANDKVDGVSPKVIANGITITSTPTAGAANNTYIADENIQITVEFDDTVYVVGTPKLPVEIGSTDTDFDYLSGNDSKKLIFQHTVAAGDEDTDGIGIEANKLKLGSQTVTIKDDIGNDAILTHAALVTQPAHKVDAIKPTVNTGGISVVSNAGADRVYVAGDEIEVQVVFSENVKVTASPQLPLIIGTKTKNADYNSGHGTPKIKFRYTVESGDEDTDGISIVADTLTLNNGTSTIKDGAGNEATLTHAALPAQASHKVGAEGPSVIKDGISITSTSGNNYYKAGAKIQVTATFNENVTVTGTPTITLTIGTAPKSAAYTSGSGSKKLVFEYTVATGNEDTDGISIDANQIVALPPGATVKDRHGNTAALTHEELTTQANHKVDAKDPKVVLNGVSITSTGAPYGIGETIQATVTFSEDVTVTGTPQLTLKIGSEDKKAGYESGTGTAKLVFAYTVADEDEDTNGISIEANKLGLNGGTIKDVAGNAAVLTYTALGTQASHKVDGVVPTIATTDGVKITSGAKTYKTGDTIKARVRFSENMTVTGTPQLALTIGTAERTADYDESESSNTDVAFEYIVKSGDADTDGISIAADRLTLNRGTITDIAGNAATLTHTALAAQTSHLVDGSAPGIIENGIAITSSPGSSGFYKIGEKIRATVTFSENVTVTGPPTNKPQLTLRIGSKDKEADYESGSGSMALVFAYTVVAGDEDTDGISIAKNSLELNGGTIQDAVGNDAALGHAAVAAQGAGGAVSAQGAQAAFGAQANFGAQAQFGAQANFGLRSASLVSEQSGSPTHKVDGIAPTISRLAFTSTPTNGNYVPGNTITATVTFSENVNVTLNGQNKPLLVLTIGSKAKHAEYARGSGTTALKFQYAVQSGDSDTNGIAIEKDSLELNGGTIKDIAGNTATLTHDALGDQAGHKVSPNQSPGVQQPPTNTPDPPTVSSVSLTSTGPYRVGSGIEVTVYTDQTITVTGMPTLTLTIGSTDRTASYTRGSGSSALVFSYTVGARETDNNGVAVKANSLALAGGTLKNSSRDLVLTHRGIANAGTSHAVDTTQPTVTTNGIAITSTPKTYKANDTITASVTFSESVTVTGRPRLFLTIGTAKREAGYIGGTGTTALNFQYTVQTGDKDTDGISIGANILELNGGTITDAAGNTATLSHAALSTQAGHKVDATTPTNPGSQSAPTISSLYLTSTGPYRVGSSVEVTLYTDQTITVTGSPTLTLTIGSTDRTARYTRGSGSAALVFSYTVVSGDNDTDGVAVKRNSLAGGTLQSSVSQKDLVLTHSSITNAGISHAVDTTQPTVTTNGIAITSTPNNSTYQTDDTIQTTVTFTENVNVTGTPRLTLKIGSAEKHATYTSGNGTTRLNFQYTVATGDKDTDGISIGANKLETNGSTIKDTVGNDATLNHTALGAQTGHKVGITNTPPPTNPGSQSPPTIRSLALTSTPNNSTYNTGDTVEVTVTFTENVNVTGTPRLTLTIGSAGKHATYISGNGTTALYFQYTVTSGDTDADGISIGANTLELNGGTIKDAAGNTATLNHTALGTQSGHKVDTTPTAPPTNPGTRAAPAISSLSFTSTGPYRAGSNIEVTVYTDQTITVTGNPTLTLVIGTTEKTARYARGSGSTALVFSYTVVAGDTDANGVAVQTNALLGGTLKNSDSRDLVRTYSGIPNAGPSHAVDSVVPTISHLAISSTPNNSTYKTDDTIQATLTFSENVTVTGTPRLTLKIGSAEKHATYTSGSTTPALNFQYTVVAGDTDTDGISVAANKLELNGGTLTDAVGNTATLNHTALPAQIGHKVDTTTTTPPPNPGGQSAPTISSLAITSTGSYPLGSSVAVTLFTSEPIDVTGTPTLTLVVGATEKTAWYARGHGSTALVFTYTIVAGDTDTDGVAVRANSLTLNGGTLKNRSSKDLVLTHRGIADAGTSHAVDSVVPTINSVAITSTPSNNSTYSAGEKIQATVTFSENVTVTGTPQLTLTIGSANKQANWTSGTGTTGHVFQYTVAAGDADTDGVSIAANQLFASGGTLRDAAGNTATLNHTALATQPGHKVDTTTTTTPATNPGGQPAPTVDSVEITSTGPYRVGSKIDITVYTNDIIYVRGKSTVTLLIGATEKTARYARGSGGFAIMFSYTVVAGDTDTDGVAVKADSFVSAGGIFIGREFNRELNKVFSLTHNGITDAGTSHAVDTTPPVVNANGLAITSTTDDDYYQRGEKLQVTVTFNESVIVTGTPTLALTIGMSDAIAHWTSGSGTNTLVFQYTVANGDVDTDGVSIAANQLSLNGGTITDAMGNSAVLTHAPLTTQTDHKVDTVIPVINTLAITSTPSNYIAYKESENIQATVTFSENVTVTGTPQVLLQIGSVHQNANYIRGNGTAHLVFEYTVAMRDEDTDGISIAANQLSLNGSTITDAAGNAATLTHDALTPQPTHKVDGIAPSINGIAMTSTPKNESAYMDGEKIQATVTFSEDVTVTGTPQLTLTIGAADRPAHWTSGGMSGTGTTTLVFEYTIVTGDADTDGISIAANQLSLNGGTITDATGNAAVLTHDALTPQTTHKVDTVIPAISTVAMTSAPKNGIAYREGEKVQATVTFNEDVTVTGTPQLTLTIGETDRPANYIRGSGTTTLVFEYTIVTGDADTDGISIAANQLSLNGGTITDTTGNAAVPTHNALTPQTNHKVDAVAPIISRLAITSTPSNESTYKAGEKIQATVTFSEDVTVTGTPQLILTIGAADRHASWTGGTGTTNLVFEYTIAPGDTDTDGVSIVENQLALNDGTVMDAAGNAAILTHAALTPQPTHTVDGIAPIISGIAITSMPSNGSAYKAGEKIQVVVTFSENVTVTDTPQLTLTIGAVDRHAHWTSGTGTPTLVFEYTIAKEDADTDGVSIAADQLSLNGGTITDATGNAAILTHAPLTTQVNHVISQPTIRSLAITRTGPYGVGSNIEVTVSTSEPIYVTGSPTLTLVIGATDRTASYTRGNGSSALAFSYTVVAGDTDTNGVAVKANSLTLNGGTLRNSVNANLQLTHNEIANAGTFHAVDTLPPTVIANGLTITSTSGNYYYQQGATLQVMVTFNERMIVTGTPTLTLTIGMGKNATYTRGSGTTNLVFEYTIAPGDTDTDGVSIAANQLSLNGGSITDAAGNAAILTHAALPTQATHKVDGIAPIISGLAITSTPSNESTYKEGERIQAAVTFNENVTVTDTPQLPLKIGAVYQNANWIRGSGTKDLVFEYTVAIGDEDTDGISIVANALTSNGGSITDAAGNVAILTHTALNTQVSHKVGGPPVPSFQTVISSLSLTSTGPYRVGSSIEVTVSTNTPIYVTGAPSLTLLVGTTEKTAQYVGGNGSATLVFTYTVVAGDRDTDGVGVKVNSLALNGGTLKDSSGNDLVLTHNAVLNAGTSHAVDTTLLEVDSVAITSMGPYGAWDTIEVTLTTTKPVTVTGSATVSVIIGNREKRASYQRGSQTNVLVFQYTVAPGDGEDPDGISVKANSLSLNGGTILDALGNSLNLNHDTLPNGGEVQRVDTTAPQVSSLAITSTGPYGVWDDAEVTLTTTKPVTVTGSATVSVIIGNTEKRANYQRGSRTNTLVFQYTVAPGDGEDPDGISVRANSLSLNGGTILDKLGNGLNLNHDALQNAGLNHRVDATTPQISDIAITSTGPYTVDDDIQVTVTTSEGVTVTGNPTLGIVIGNTERKAVLFSGNGTSALGFRYKVTAADEDDTDGISVKANALRTNGGKITDSVGNALKLTHSAISNAGETQSVGTTVSSIHSIALTSQGPYKVNDTIQVTVVTSEKVNVTGAPRIPIKLGMATKYADYVSGSETTALVFQYTVVAGDTDADGIEIAQNALENYSGSIIKNIYQTDLDLNHGSVAADAGQKVDTTEWWDTVLFTNYPNPFNPETWIPYQLGEAAEVTVRIYAATGHLVRTLALGYKAPGIYKRRGEAAYWDGKNELGEPAASGIYFYTFTAGDFTATRKMLIVR